MPRKRKQKVKQENNAGDINKIKNSGTQFGIKPMTLHLLLSSGYDTFDSISSMIEDDLQQLPISMGQKSLLRKWVESIRRSRLVTHENPRIHALSKSRSDKTLEKFDQTDESGPQSYDQEPEVVIVDGKPRYRPKVEVINETDDSESQEQEHHQSISPFIPQSRSKTDRQLVNAANFLQENNMKDNMVQEFLPAHPLNSTSASIGFYRSTHIKDTSNCVIADKVEIIKNEIATQQINNENFRAQVKLILKHQSNGIFLKTSAFQDALDVLEDAHQLIITGRPGYGKTTMGLQLLLKKNEYEPIILKSPSMWDEFVNPFRKQIIFIDDIFGSYTYDHDRSQEWSRHFMDIKTTVEESKGETLLIIACRNYIIQEACHRIEGRELFKQHFTIDLCKQELTEFEKKKLLDLYDERYSLQLNRKCINDIIQYSEECEYGFPYCLKLFSTSYSIRSMGPVFFENPIEFLYEEIRNFERNDKLKYCTFVMVTLFGCLQKSTLDDSLERTEKQKLALRVSGLSDNTPFKGILEALHDLDGIYFESYSGNTLFPHNMKQNGFTFIHETLAETTTYAITESNPRLAISSFPLSYILARTRLENSKNSQRVPLYNCIPKDLYSNLCNRFLDQIAKQSNDVSRILSHECWNDKCFVAKISDYCSIRSDLKNVHELLLVKGTVGLSVFFWSAWNRKETTLHLFCEKIVEYDLVAKYPWLKTEVSDTFIAACYLGLSEPLLKRLISIGADVNAKFSEIYYDIEDLYFNDPFDEVFVANVVRYKLPPIVSSVYKHQTSIFRFLLCNGANLHVNVFENKSILHVIAEEDASDILLEIVKEPHLFSFPTTEITPYHLSKSVKVLDILLKLYPQFLGRTCSGGKTFLHTLSKYEIGRDSNMNVPITKWICFNAQHLLNHRTDKGLTVLHYLVKSHISDKTVSECLELFISYGAQVNAITKRRRTPLHSVARCRVGRSLTTSILIKYGCKLFEEDYRGRTALFYAMYMSNGVASVLLEYKASINCKDKSGTPMFIYVLQQICNTCDEEDAREDGIQYLDKKFLAKLISYGISMNEKDPRTGDGVLHILLRNVHSNRIVETIDFLLQFGADPNITNKEGETPTVLAACRSIPLLDLFLSYNGNLFVSKTDGKTVLHLALEKSSEEYCLTLIKYLGKRLMHYNH